MLFAIALFLIGLFIKGGLVPFHGWLPDAYSTAPAVTSIALSGIITKTTGIYSVLRFVIDVCPRDERVQGVLLTVGVITVLFGALAAMSQQELRRLLAYSSISQVGYIIVGLGAGNILGYVGAGLHLFNHAVFKSLLFLNASSAERKVESRRLEDMKGLGSEYPFLGLTTSLAFLSTAGIPPLSGFWSKLIIIMAVWQAGFIGTAVVALLASVLTIVYFLHVQKTLLASDSTKTVTPKRLSLWENIPAAFLGGLTVGLGLSFPWLFETFLVPIRSFF